MFDVACNLAYQQPVKYNLAVARGVFKHVYTAERLRPPTSLGAVFGTYGTLWARARSLGYWREVVRSGEYARLGVYALEAYGIFKVRYRFLYASFSSLSIRVWSDRAMACSRLERLWGVGRLSAIMLSRVGHHTVSRSVELGTSTPPYLLQYAASARLAPSRSIIDSILRMFYSASSTEH